MLMRHFGHGIGHIQFERQYELENIEPGIADDSDDADTTETGEVEIDGNHEDSEGVGDDDDSDGSDSANDSLSDGYASF
jgi:hypothetical protein